MPVTAKLSRRFYERLGDDIANELVEWFNAVDATYRADLRELNESNFARFDATVGHRFAESEAKAGQRFAEFEAKVGQRFTEFEAKVGQRFAEFEVKVERRIADTRAGLMTWIVGLWITSALSFAGIILTLWRLR